MFFLRGTFPSNSKVNDVASDSKLTPPAVRLRKSEAAADLIFVILVGSRLGINHKIIN